MNTFMLVVSCGAIFLGGVIVGTVTTLVYVGRGLNKIIKLATTTAPVAAAADSSGTATISPEMKIKIVEWIKEAAALAEKQIDLARQLDYPSKNASHSRWKNGIVTKMKEMENQKIALFKQIVDAGFDPLITVIGRDGQPSKIKMSEAIGLSAADDQPSPPVAQTTEPQLSEPGDAKVVKFPTKKGDQQ